MQYNGSNGHETVTSRVVRGEVSEVSSMTRSPMVLDVVLVLRRSCLHEDAPGKSWSALRDACRTSALCFKWREFFACYA